MKSIIDEIWDFLRPRLWVALTVSNLCSSIMGLMDGGKTSEWEAFRFVLNSIFAVFAICDHIVSGVAHLFDDDDDDDDGDWYCNCGDCQGGPKGRENEMELAE